MKIAASARTIDGSWSVNLWAVCAFMVVFAGVCVTFGVTVYKTGINTETNEAQGKELDRQKDYDNEQDKKFLEYIGKVNSSLNGIEKMLQERRGRNGN